MYRSHFFLLLFFVIAFFSSFAQKYPQDYFRNPVGIPITLAGSFGELRFNHFHSGFDIRTNGVEGMPVYAAADGWICRIRVQGANYGNAIYISHPNGYTTLYGHLQRFSETIRSFVKQEQYRTESFEQDIRPDSEHFRVRQGDLIGYSGNSGASRAPHLHFEIRETLTETCINPILFMKSQVKDNIPPVIRSIKVYPLDSHSYVKVFFRKGSSREAIYGGGVAVDVSRRPNGNFALNGVSRIEAYGTIGFAIHAVDYYSDHESTLAPYAIDLYVDKKNSYHQQLEKVEFARQKYINAHTDYPEFIKFNRWYERSYRLPNDSLDIYSGSRDGGRVTIKNSETRIEYVVRDLNDSLAILPFTVSKALAKEIDFSKNKDFDSILCFDVENKLIKEDFKMCMPRRALYDNMAFSFSAEPVKGKEYSEVFKLEDPYTPFNYDCSISIRADKIPARLRSKVCIISDMRGYLGGKYTDDWVTAPTRALGKFYLTVDTISPSIHPVNIREAAKMSGKKSVSFTITDNLSGIRSFRGTIDGHWVLFKFDSKKSHLWYDFDEHCTSGDHTLELTVTDNRNNVRVQKWSFSR